MARAISLPRTLLAALGLAMIGAPATAAGVYVHSDSEQQTIDAMVDQLGAARTAQIGALDAQKAYLTAAMARERQLLAERGLAQRDQQLATVMSAPGRGAEPGKLLKQAIDFDLTQLFGGKVTIDTQVLRSLERDIQRQSRRLNGHRTQLDRHVTSFEALGGEGAYCDDNGVGVPLELAAPGNSHDQFTRIKALCTDIAADIAVLNGNYDVVAEPALRALLGDSRETGDFGGDVGAALTEQRQLGTLITAQRLLTSAANAQVKALDRFYKCQQGIPDLIGSVSANAEAMQALVDQLAKGDPAVVFDPATFEAAVALLTAPTRPDCGPAPAAGPAAPAALDTAEVLRAVNALDRHAAGSALLSGIRQAALAVQASAVSGALNGLATVNGPAPDDRAGRIARAALKLAGNISTLQQAQAGTLPDTGGILVALADLRMKQASAAIEADRLQALQKLARLRLLALRQQVIHLADAQAALQAASPVALDRALLRYGDSWNQGAIPASILENDMIKGRYLPWLAREKVVIEAMYAMLQPAMAELQTYGKGGFKAETIAGYLQALGIGAIAVTQ